MCNWHTDVFSVESNVAVHLALYSVGFPQAEPFHPWQPKSTKSTRTTFTYLLQLPHSLLHHFDSPWVGLCRIFISGPTHSHHPSLLLIKATSHLVDSSLTIQTEGIGVISVKSASNLVGQWFSKCGLWMSITNLYGNLIEMQIFVAHPRPTEPLRLGPAICVLIHGSGTKIGDRLQYNKLRWDLSVAIPSHLGVRVDGLVITALVLRRDVVGSSPQS